MKAHPLFNGVNFALLHKQKAPLVDIVSPYKQKSQPYATFEELAQRHMPTRKHFLSDDLQNLEKEHTEPKQIKVEPQKVSVETHVTEENQEIMSGLVSKKCGWLFFRTRFLVLNNKPSLSYFDPDTKQFKVK